MAKRHLQPKESEVNGTVHELQKRIAELERELAAAHEIKIGCQREVSEWQARAGDIHVEREALRAKLAEAQAEAVALWESLPHDCETLDTTAGIITQINNWCAGALAERNALRESVIYKRESLDRHELKAKQLRAQLAEATRARNADGAILGKLRAAVGELWGRRDEWDACPITFLAQVHSEYVDGSNNELRMEAQLAEARDDAEHWKKGALVREEFNFGWFWVYADYPEEGSCGPFEDLEQAKEHALASGDVESEEVDYTFWEMKDHRPFEQARAEARAERDEARGALTWIAQEFWSGCGEVDSLEWQEEMERRGLLVKTNPTEDHIAEWGDDADMYTLKWLANAAEESDDDG